MKPPPPTFGLRGASPATARGAAPADKRPWMMLICGVLLVAISTVSFALHSVQRPLQDVAPGMSVDIGPYVAPPGCPSRRWSVGEHLPRACRPGNTYVSETWKLGLEAPRRRHRDRHNSFWDSQTRAWVRHDTDALAVVCFARCKIVNVVRDRFAMSASPLKTGENAVETQALEPAPAAVGMSFRKLLSVGGALMFALIGIALFVRHEALAKRSAAEAPDRRP